MGKKLVKKKKLVGSGKKPHMTAEDKAYWRRESKALAATEKDFSRIWQSMKVAKSFDEVDRLLKEGRALFDAHPSDSTARKLPALREAANNRYKELGWTPDGGRPSKTKTSDIIEYQRTTAKGSFRKWDDAIGGAYDTGDKLDGLIIYNAPYHGPRGANDNFFVVEWSKSAGIGPDASGRWVRTYLKKQRKSVFSKKTKRGLGHKNTERAEAEKRDRALRRRLRQTA